MSHQTMLKKIYAGPKTIPMCISIGVGLLIWFSPIPTGIEPQAWQLLAVFVGLIV